MNKTVQIDYEYDPSDDARPWLAKNKALGIYKVAATKREATERFLNSYTNSKKFSEHYKLVRIERCSFHNEAYSELWPNQFLCESCLEAEYMTPEEVEPVTDEINKYLNSIQDSE
jgi:hypothetical protein